MTADWGSAVREKISDMKAKTQTADWGPVVVAAALFIIFSPGLLFQFPARRRIVEFGNMYTSGISVILHAVLFACIYIILIIAVGVHIHAT